MSRSRIALVVLFFAALLVPVPPAQAASTVLCTGYTSCAGQGYSHFGYAEHKGTSYWNMYTGTNCTNYIAYRLITTNGMSTTRPKPGVGNARDWGTAMASVTDSTPAVGSVAWWGKTGNHVAYIERVVSSSEIWVSESNWSGAFDWRKVTKSGGGWPDGFIHFDGPPALINSSAPRVVGTAQVGTAVKASVGAWSPTPGSYAYQWLLDGAAISGATAKEYTPTASTAGKGLSVTITAARSGYPTVKVASPPVTVAPGTLTASTRPAVSGTAQVGSRLTTTTGTWSRKDVSYAYQWFAGAKPVEGATGSSYVARSVDVGVPVTARVTASRAGYTTTSSDAPATSAVAPGTLVRRSAPSVTGTARVGSRLTAAPGTWSPTATVSFQWYADGRAIAGATASTFVPTHRERGAAIRVRVTARRAGFTSLSATSAATPALGTGRISISGSPVISGSAQLGAALKIEAGTFAPTSASVRYQWFRDGAAVRGATSRTRKVSANDLGHRLSATVTYKATGFSARTVSTPSAKRARTAPKISVAARPAGSGAVTFDVTVRASRLAAPSGTITIRGTNGRARTVKIARGRAQFTLSGQTAGPQTYRITFRATSAIASGSRDKTITVK